MRADQALNVAIAALKLISDSQEAFDKPEAAERTKEATVDLAKLLHVLPGARLQRTTKTGTELECSACKNIFPWELDGDPSEAINYCPSCGAPIIWGKEPINARPAEAPLKLNVNSFIKIKLTQTGINILRQQHERRRIVCKELDIGAFNLHLDAHGYYIIQLWEFAQMFGEHLKNGLNSPFETEIIINNADLY